MALKPVPKDNKGLGKLPTEVRNKMGYMAKGGRVSFKARPKPMPKSAISKPSRTKPKPGGLGALSTAPKPTTFTGKINTETQKLQNIDGKTVVVNKSNESGRSISDADRARVSKMMGKIKKPRGMEKGGEAKKTGSMASRKKNREYTKLDYEKDKFKEVAKRVGKVAKTPYNLVTKGMAGAFKEFSELVDTPMPKFPKVGSRKKNVVKKNKGGLVKGGTSSQMSGQHYKGTF